MNRATKFAVGLVQTRCGTDLRENTERALAGIREAAKQGAQVVCLQELFRSRYFCQREDTASFDLAESIPGETSDALGRVAKEAGVAVVGSLFERRAAGIYHNTATIHDADGSLLGLYRKMHIPDDPLYYEKYYFTPGDLGFRVFDTRFGRIGALVCWDQWYPEAARLTALQGADVLFYPTAIGWHPKEKINYGKAQAEAWTTMMRSHAIANGVYVCAANRVGLERPENPSPSDEGIEFWGGSFVCDPFGVMLKEAGRVEEEVIVVEIDRTHQEEVRRNWPFLRDRRIDAYAPITRRFIDD